MCSLYVESKYIFLVMSYRTSLCAFLWFLPFGFNVRLIWSLNKQGYIVERCGSKSERFKHGLWCNRTVKDNMQPRLRKRFQTLLLLYKWDQHNERDNTHEHERHFQSFFSFTVFTEKASSHHTQKILLRNERLVNKGTIKLSSTYL